MFFALGSLKLERSEELESGKLAGSEKLETRKLESSKALEIVDLGRGQLSARNYSGTKNGVESRSSHHGNHNRAQLLKRRFPIAQKWNSPKTKLRILQSNNVCFNARMFYFRKTWHQIQWRCQVCRPDIICLPGKQIKYFCKSKTCVCSSIPEEEANWFSIW